MKHAVRRPPGHARQTLSRHPRRRRPARPAGAILYNGHAGLGSNTAIKDGTSNTLQVGALILMADAGGQ
jgi:hypothetical protein